MGEALGGFEVVCSWWVFCVVVVFWTDSWFIIVDWSCCSCSSSSIMMVPPPCSISWVMRSWTGVWASDEGIGFRPGVGIGRKVMVVVFRCWDIRRFVMLSVWAAVMVVVFELLLACWRVLRQAVVIGRRMAIRRVMVMFVFFIVVIFDSKGNTFGRSVQ